MTKWGGQRIHWNGLLFTLGRNYSMEGVSKDKLPKMITLSQDGFGDLDEDHRNAALEAYSFLMAEPGVLLDVYCLTGQELRQVQLLLRPRKSPAQVPFD